LLNKNLIGSRLIELRKIKKLTQKEVADGIGCLRSTLSNIELGKKPASLDMVIALADFYEVPIDYLLGRDLKVKDVNIELPDSSKIKSKSDVDKIIEDMRKALSGAIKDGHISEKKGAEILDLARKQLLLVLEQAKK